MWNETADVPAAATGWPAVFITKVDFGRADTSLMNIDAAAAWPTQLASMGVSFQRQNLQTELGMAVMEQQQTAEQQQAQALLQMINQSTAAARGGVDLYA